MRNNERIIQFYDVAIAGRSTSRDINYKLLSPKSLDELMNYFLRLKDDNHHKQTYGALEFSLTDVKEYDDYWVLLINLIDTGVADQVTNKVGGNPDDREVIEFRNQRGLETSTHIVIYKAVDAIHRHFVLYDKNLSIPFSKAEAYINNLARKAMKYYPDDFKQPHPSGVQNKSMNVYCQFTFLGHPSDEFRDELETGKISGIKLAAGVDVINGYDAAMHPELISTEIRMAVKAIDILNSGGNWLHLLKALNYARNLNAANVRVQFTDQQGNSHNAILSTDTHQLQNSDRYVKKAKIENFTEILRTAYTEVNEQIVEKMINIAL